MSAELRELYQEIILDHNKSPRNCYAMKDASTQAIGFNPLCGDKLTVYLKIDQNKIDNVSFVGCGCAISQASASLMTESLKGKTVEEAQQLFELFHHLLTCDEDQNSWETLPARLAVLSGVRAFPARVKCATLAWHALEAALQKKIQVVTTE